jgi:proline iminopeptidase
MPQDVALISISMNPDADSPRALKHWARSFGVRKGWTLVSSNSAEMRKMIKDFTGNPPGRREAHYSIVFIGNDRSGSWVAANGTNSPAELIKLIKVVTGSESVSGQQEALEPGPHMFEVNGVHLWYRVAGRRTGVPVVFLHGGPGEGSQAFQAFGGPQLEKTQRLIYFDQRGAGHSDRPKDASHYSIPIMVDDIEQLRIHLGVPRIVLVGHSFGSQLALEYASKYSERTAALVLVAATPNLLRSFDLLCERLAKEDPTAYARATQDMKAGSMPRCNVQHAYEGEAANAFMSRNLFPDPATAKQVQLLDPPNTGEASGALFGKGLLSYRFDATAKVRAPVLAIAGGRDYLAALQVQRDLVAELPQASLIEYPEGGHFLFVEQPQRFADDVATFLRRYFR